MSKAAEFAVILKMNPMFTDLGADELQRISGLCHTQQLGLGEMLFQKGDACDALSGGRAVLDGQSRTGSATAGEPTELFVLRREDFLCRLAREPKVAIKISM